MEIIAAAKLEQFEQGKISRRKLIESLTLAATAVTAAGSAQAQGQQVGVKAALVNHISYTNPNFRQAGDWYSKVFNLDQIGIKDNELTLPFGKMGEKPFGVTANDVPLTFIISRTRNPNAAPANGAAPRPRATNLIDHMAYTVADFERDRVKANLIAMGIQNVRDGGLYSLHMTDPFGYDVQISGVANNAVSDGA